jgi:hypothetical protein
MGEQGVFRFDVAVNDALGMRGIESIGDFAGQPERLVNWQLGFTRQSVAQALALNEGHGIPHLTGSFP